MPVYADTKILRNFRALMALILTLICLLTTITSVLFSKNSEIKVSLNDHSEKLSQILRTDNININASLGLVPDQM